MHAEDHAAGSAISVPRNADVLKVEEIAADDQHFAYSTHGRGEASPEYMVPGIHIEIAIGLEMHRIRCAYLPAVASSPPADRVDQALSITSAPTSAFRE